MITTDKQVRRLREEMSRHGRIGLASLRAGMDRATGRKYMKAGRLPSELKEERSWRTREDPFAAVWELDVVPRLVDAPELEAKALFEDLLRRRPGEFEEGQLRTFQRHVRRWRAEHGPPREVFFPQAHRPGEAAQTDFTWASCLGITIRGEPFPHLLCHVVLPYSNWEWATVCRSESMAALRRGVQAALFTLGRVPEFHQTDNSTAATHNLGSGKRGFNKEYEALMRHFGLKPRTIGIGDKEQNGDVEALNGAVKRRLAQHLLLRGSCDFESVADYEAWVQDVMTQANGLRKARLAEDLEAMLPLKVDRLPEFSVQKVRVTQNSTIRVRNNTYSVPSRLRGEELRVRVYDERIEAYFAGKLQMATERLLGEGGHRIDYRHVIWSLVRKPGAFERYRFRQDLFPTLTFRRAYDALADALSRRQADIDYLRILHLAAATMECEVEAALELLLEAGAVPRLDAVQALVSTEVAEMPELAPLKTDLSTYDDLLTQEEIAS